MAEAHASRRRNPDTGKLDKPSRPRPDLSPARAVAVREVGHALARALDEPEILLEVSRQAGRLLEADLVCIALSDERTGRLLVSHVSRTGERGRESDSALAGMPIVDGPLTVVATTGEPVKGELKSGDQLFGAVKESSQVELAASPGAGSLLAVPAMLGLELLGVIAVYSARTDPAGVYSAEDEEVLLTVAAQAAAAIANARLYAESQRERRQSEALADIARAVGESLRLNDVLSLILRHTRALLHTEGASVALKMGEDELEVVAADGSGAMLVGHRVPLLGSVSGRTMRQGSASIVNDTYADPDSFSGTRDAPSIRKTVIVPLTTAAGAIGVLAAFNREADFREDDARILQRLADQVAVAIVNARLFEEVAQATREWSAAFESIASGMAVLDADGRIVRCNGRAAQLCGVDTPGLLAGCSFLEAVLGEKGGHGSAYDLVHRVAIGERRVGRASHRMPERGRIYELIASPHPNGGAVVTFDDVTAHHILSERYRLVVETTSDAIVITDPERRIAFANPAALELFGRKSLVGTPVVEIVAPEHVQGVLDRESRAFEGQPQSYETVITRSDGDQRIVSVSTAPLLELGQVTGIVASLRDVTAERRLTKQVLQQEKLAAIGQLVSGVAHELNNPLAGVMAFSQLLLASSDVPREHAEALEAIHTEARRAARIVANLLTFARQHQPERRAIDVNQVVLDTLELRQYAMRVRQIGLEIRTEADLPETWADQFQLQQVLLNLVTNAEQALEDWEGEKRITVSTQRDDGMLRIGVADTGPGIRPEHLDQIFNPFFTTKGVGEGTGLGLSISDGIVREHGGRIRVESRPGGGAVFTVELPLVDPPPPPGSPVAGAQRPGSRPARQSVLVVDDEPAIRTALQRYLRNLGHDVDVVGTGVEALANLRHRRYDTILLDLRMPDMAGDALYERIKAGDPEQAARVVFVTGDVQNDSAREFIRATGRPCISKPFALDEVTAALNQGVPG